MFTQPTLQLHPPDPGPAHVLVGGRERRFQAYERLCRQNPLVLNKGRWVDKGVLPDLTSQLFEVDRPHGLSHLLETLVCTKEFIVHGPLREVLDRGTCCTRLFQAIWEIRFLKDEGKSWKTLCDPLLQWMTRVEWHSDSLRSLHVYEGLSENQAYDTLLCFLTMAQQHTRSLPVLYVMDDFAQAACQSTTRGAILDSSLMLLETAQKWCRLGSDFQMIWGVDNLSSLDRIRRHKAKLHQEIQSLIGV